VKSFLNSEAGREFLSSVYGESGGAGSGITDRYLMLYDSFKKNFDSESLYAVSVPGRVEVIGNHTDHNRGKVMAGSINLDAAVLFSPAEDMTVTMHDLAYREVLKVDLSSLEKRESESGTPEALIRGVAAGFIERGYSAGGFNAVIHNEVMSGSGLSSSAVFEVAVGSVLNVLYNRGEIGSLDLAEIGQFAENVYFDKPCGLMDQCACAYGGLVAIDFENPAEPVISSLPSFSDSYSVYVVKTGGDHASLTSHYASIPEEMKGAASVLGRGYLRGISFDDLIDAASGIRAGISDRAFLRALHFLEENARVDAASLALSSGNTGEFMELVRLSGASSWMYLQNVIPEGSVKDQKMGVVLGVSDAFVRSRGRGATRVHGGGFAGTVLSFIHNDDAGEYVDLVERVAGKGCAVPLSIREAGALSVEVT